MTNCNRPTRIYLLAIPSIVENQNLLGIIYSYSTYRKYEYIDSYFSDIFSHFFLKQIRRFFVAGLKKMLCRLWPSSVLKLHFERHRAALHNYE